jgi:outer membrane receptor protein involved in Fe transport
MKYTILITILTAFSLHLKAQKILSSAFHIQKKKATVEEFLHEINSGNGSIIQYASNQLDTEKIVEVDGTERSLGAVLQKVLLGQKVKLVEKNNKILLVPSNNPIGKFDLLKQYNLFGFIREVETKEPMIDATVTRQNPRKSVITNPHGYYNILLTEGKHKLIFSYTGFQPQAIEINIQSDTRKDIELLPKEDIQEGMVIKSYTRRRDASEKIASDEHSSYNYFMGENDPARATYLLPGVKNVHGSFNGFLVRGGGLGENIFLLDGNPVYNPTHMLGALSIVSQTSLKSMRLFKSDFPARFNGAISSVTDVYTKDGNMNEWHGEINAGVVASSFALEGPIDKGKTSMMTSIRRSWSLPFMRSFQKKIQPDFYDAHIKMTHLIGEKDKLMLNLYKGEDRLKQYGQHLDNLHKWGNTLASLGWNHVLGSKSFLNTSINLSHYNNLGGFKYTLFSNDENEEVLLTRSLGTYSSVTTYNIKSQAEIHATNNFRLQAGAKLAHTMIKPFETKISTLLQENERDFNSFQALESDELSAFVENEIRIGKKWMMRPGLHVSVYQFESDRFVIMQPRFYTSYRISRSHRFFFSYNKLAQHLHLVTSPYMGPNSDIWIPSTRILKPETSESFNLGYQFRKKEVRFSIDAYHKTMKGVTNYAEGKSFFINQENWQQNIETGKGRSYGVEWMIEKKSYPISFHIAYTLAWSWRQFKSINEGKQFPYKYDRRHDLNAGMICHLTKKINFSGLWSFATGDVYSLPDQIYPDFDYAQQVRNPDDILKDYRFLYHYSAFNQFRASPYHRLDMAANYHTIKKKTEYQLTAGLYNLYGAPDQYSYDLKGYLSSRTIFIEQKNRLFNTTPYISLSVKF